MSSGGARMWEAISNVLTSSNGFKTEIIVIVAIGMFLLAAKLNLISISGKFLRVGVIKDKERDIMRRQLAYMNARLDCEMEKLPEGLDFYRTKYVISKCKDFFENIIVFNHIRTDDGYLDTKYMEFHSLIMGLTENPFFKTEEWNKQEKVLVSDILFHIFDIRNEEEGKKR